MSRDSVGALGRRAVTPLRISAVQWAAISSIVVVSCTTTLPVAPAPPVQERESIGCVPVLEAMKTVNPQYPRKAFEARQEGWVQVLFDTGPDGTPTNIRILASSPPGIFESAVTTPLKRARFPSGGRNCEVFTEFKLK